MVQDLRHDQELADRGRVFDGESRHVRTQRLHRAKKFAHPHQRGLTCEVQLAIGIDAAADRVLKLRIVHPELDLAHAETIGAHFADHRDERAGGAVIRCRSGLGLKRGDHRLKAGELVRVGSGKAVGHAGQGFRIAEITGEFGAAAFGIEGGAKKLSCNVWRQRVEPCGISAQALRLFGKTEAQAGGPTDVGPPIHVIADPGREAERQRAEPAPVPGPLGLRFAQQVGHDPRTGILPAFHRCHRRIVFVIERDRIARTVSRAQGLRPFALLRSEVG